MQGVTWYIKERSVSAGLEGTIHDLKEMPPKCQRDSVFYGVQVSFVTFQDPPGRSPAFSRSLERRRARTRARYTTRCWPKAERRLFSPSLFSPPHSVGTPSRVRINPKHKHYYQPGRSDDSAYTEQRIANASQYPSCDVLPPLFRSYPHLSQFCTYLYNFTCNEIVDFSYNDL